MRAYKVCIDDCEHREQGLICCSNVYFSDIDSMVEHLDYLCRTMEKFEFRVFPVEIKVKYPWSKEFEER